MSDPPKLHAFVLILKGRLNKRPGFGRHTLHSPPEAFIDDVNWDGLRLTKHVGITIRAQSVSLINKSAEELDSVRIWPLIEALASPADRVEEPRDLYVT